MSLVWFSQQTVWSKYVVGDAVVIALQLCKVLFYLICRTSHMLPSEDLDSGSSK